MAGLDAVGAREIGVSKDSEQLAKRVDAALKRMFFTSKSVPVPGDLVRAHTNIFDTSGKVVAQATISASGDVITISTLNHSALDLPTALEKWLNGPATWRGSGDVIAGIISQRRPGAES